MNKLREYKGITFNVKQETWNYNGVEYTTIGAILRENPALTLLDHEYETLMDLKANPHEPSPTLEQVVRDALCEISIKTCCGIQHYDDALCARLREAFPQIDVPSEVDTFSPEPTVKEQAAHHISALVDMGAKRVQQANVYTSNGPLSGEVRYNADAIILPPEMTP